MHFPNSMKVDSKQKSTIAQTGFYTSLVSYIFFWMLDLLHPGFVARFFSVHIFLIGVIGFGVWWGSCVQEYTDHPRAQYAISIFCGVLFVIMTWNLTKEFDTSRVVISAIAFVVPIFILRLLKYK